jgi:hypothetical protein
VETGFSKIAPISAFFVLKALKKLLIFKALKAKNAVISAIFEKNLAIAEE